MCELNFAKFALWLRAAKSEKIILNFVSACACICVVACVSTCLFACVCAVHVCGVEEIFTKAQAKVLVKRNAENIEQ